jgi:geranylgeranyl pyrophosphate synthase
MNHDNNETIDRAGGAATANAVPPTSEMRRRLRELAAQYVVAAGLVAPLDTTQLQSHAKAIADAQGVGEQFSRFIAVQLNNEVWKPALARIPFERRLLLLPMCLRNRAKCRAAIDELGLSCQQCGSCVIGDLQAQALRLGYVVLVAEGSALVTSLIKAGKVDAIVGVSCMSVLEQVFPFMEAAAIPGIATPLLADGCRDTNVDTDWVWDAMHLTSGDNGSSAKRFDLDRLRKEVEAWFTPARLVAHLGDPRTSGQRIAMEWLSRSGKRWRPFLAACAYQAVNAGGDAAPPDDFLKIAIAVECFHKASLVHDDIEDGDEFRYGRKTLHQEYGVPVALNVGDLLLGEGYRMISQCQASDAAKVRMLAAAADGHRTLCIGQGEELSWMCAPGPLSSDSVLEIFRQKTAPAFQVALQLGAIYGGGKEDVHQVLEHYSEALGVAYQIRDDLEDFAVDERAGSAPQGRPLGSVSDGANQPAPASNSTTVADTPAPIPNRSGAEIRTDDVIRGRVAPIAALSPSAPGGDAKAARPSLLLALAHQRASGAQRELLERLWRRQEDFDKSQTRLGAIFAELGVEQDARQLLDLYKQRAIGSLGLLEDPTLKGLLRRVISKIFDDTGTMASCWEHKAADAPNDAGVQAAPA